MSSGTKISETCLVVGNGPSLAKIPNDFLAQYVTFGSNRCYLKFVPDYYAIIDTLWLQPYLGEVSKLDCQKFIVTSLADRVSGAVPLHTRHTKQFSFQPLDWIYQGHTVTFVLLELAFYFGFEKVGLIGVDHRYSFDGEVGTKQTGRDINHFSEDYYGKNDTWWRPDLKKTETAYAMAKEAFEKDGREIINITPNSALDIFPKENWEDWCIR